MSSAAVALTQHSMAEYLHFLISSKTSLSEKHTENLCYFLVSAVVLKDEALRRRSGQMQRRQTQQIFKDVILLANKQDTAVVCSLIKLFSVIVVTVHRECPYPENKWHASMLQRLSVQTFT